MHTGLIYRVSQKSNPPKTFAYILPCGYPPQTKIYPFVWHSYPHLCTSFCPVISIFVRNVTVFVTVTPEFYRFITAFCSIHQLLRKQTHFVNEIIQKKYSSVTVLSVITFYIQSALNKLTH